MITVETRDIGKLAKYIRIPSMAKGSTEKDPTVKKSYIQASRINAENAANLGISPELTQWPKSQFGVETLLQALPQHGMKG